MQPEDFKKFEETKGEAKKVIQELGPDELAAVESISAGEGDVVICNSGCARAPST
ncbi:MAG TPA: hypothetical protein VF516_06165 [Kofleriaceae bacterium]